ncbi:MAG: S8 family serine peptidase [Verrucomicrobia subdivision 3 bacterium]|nr:S8 family serine peptidase [Limisphaerales bacterium]
MAQEVQKDVLPNDPLFGNQWNLRNTQQTGGVLDADVYAEEAWNGSQGYGSRGIRIAILDDGVQTSHPDLNDNIIPGFDFWDNENDPNPHWDNDNHGTAVAGIAAAEVNNLTGVAGVAGKCRILPVRMLGATPVDMYRAIVYAADNADVINCSWHLDTPSSTVSSGFWYAWNYGRGGKGCPVLCSSGNKADGEDYLDGNSYKYLWGPWEEPLFDVLGQPQTCRVRFEYNKDGVGSATPNDCFWLADVTFPDGTRERLDSDTLPSNWFTVATPTQPPQPQLLWSGSIDPAHAHGTTPYAWRSGTIGHNQWSAIVTRPFNITSQQSTIMHRRWLESEGGDVALMRITDASGNPLSGVPPLNQLSGKPRNPKTAVNYPANLSYVLAVGASGDFDYRVSYSQYGPSLDFLAPSDGGYGAIATTDRTGSYGYLGWDDYRLDFGGTSAAAPLAAGIAALVLSKDGNLTRASVVSKLTQNCDKVGPVAYTGTPPLTRNDYYGHGRLNAQLALAATTADTTAPTFTLAQTINHRAVDVTFSEPMGEGAEDPTKYQITVGQGSLTLNPNKVLRIMPTVYRLVWNSGDIIASGTVTIKVLSGVKDVAGNLLPANVTRNTAGTKRIIAVNLGRTSNNGASFDDAIEYLPPFDNDNGFQGNEQSIAVQLSSSTKPAVYYNINAINRSGLTDPAPEKVYQSIRVRWDDYDPETSTEPISYGLEVPQPNGTFYTVRLHFAEIYWNNMIGYQVFDICVNNVLQYENFDIRAVAGAANRAYIYEVTIQAFASPVNIKLVPKMGIDGQYRAAINAIEIVKP